MSLRKVLLLPHIKVHNANALSSPYTIGFPAMTAWLGAVHALQRKLNQNGFIDARFLSVAVVSHEVNLQAYKGPGDYVHSIVGTANPLDRHGNRQACIEEARCHLDVSLLVEYRGVEKDQESAFIDAIIHVLHGQLKIAGGDILQSGSPQCFKVDEWEESDLKKVLRRLMPGYVIVDRSYLMREAMEQGADAIDALLDYLTIKHRSEKSEDGSVTWHSQRKSKGWLVPIATGFHGLTELGQAENQRDPETPHRFAESVITLGEFVMPYRIDALDDMLWHYHVNEEQNLYLCKQNNQSN